MNNESQAKGSVATALHLSLVPLARVRFMKASTFSRVPVMFVPLVSSTATLEPMSDLMNKMSVLAIMALSFAVSIPSRLKVAWSQWQAN